MRADLRFATREPWGVLVLDEASRIKNRETSLAQVFSQFTNDQFGVGLVCRWLKRYRPLAYTGSMSPTQRSQATDRFLQDDAQKVLVLSLRAGGVGLNLQSASYVFHLDRWWNPAIEEQADS